MIFLNEKDACHGFKCYIYGRTSGVKQIKQFSSLLSSQKMVKAKQTSYPKFHHCWFLLFKIFFWCGPFLKSLLNLLQYCFGFIFWFFVCEAYRILDPSPGIKLTPPALEGEVLATRPPEKLPHHCQFLINVLQPKLNLRVRFWRNKSVTINSFYCYYLDCS